VFPPELQVLRTQNQEVLIVGRLESVTNRARRRALALTGGNLRKSLALAAAMVMALSASSAALAAAPCRDAKGKFIKCPAAAAPAKPNMCKDAKGKFAKCGAPGAKPA
jgi:hypothetical protein